MPHTPYPPAHLRKVNVLRRCQEQLSWVYLGYRLIFSQRRSNHVVPVKKWPVLHSHSYICDVTGEELLFSLVKSVLQTKPPGCPHHCICLIVSAHFKYMNWLLYWNEPNYCSHCSDFIQANCVIHSPLIAVENYEGKSEMINSDLKFVSANI